MLEIPDDFEINRSVIKENSSFQELNTLLEETRNFMYEMSFLAYGDKTDFMKYVELKDLGKDESNIYDWIRNQQNSLFLYE